VSRDAFGVMTFEPVKVGSTPTAKVASAAEAAVSAQAHS
jgi:hypothetical protein